MERYVYAKSPTNSMPIDIEKPVPIHSLCLIAPEADFVVLAGARVGDGVLTSDEDRFVVIGKPDTEEAFVDAFNP